MATEVLERRGQHFVQALPEMNREIAFLGPSFCMMQVGNGPYPEKERICNNDVICVIVRLCFYWGIMASVFHGGDFFSVSMDDFVDLGRS